MNAQKQHELYRQAERQFASAIARLARAMERDLDKARDLEQDIHCELFKSFARFKGDCALKTWVYRVAHNVAAEHRMRHSRGQPSVPLEDMEQLPDTLDQDRANDEADAIAKARELIRRLPLLDAQVMLLWLEGETAQEIAQVSGLQPGAVATRIHRLKTTISEQLAPETERHPSHD